VRNVAEKDEKAAPNRANNINGEKERMIESHTHIFASVILEHIALQNYFPNVGEVPRLLVEVKIAENNRRR